jgi:hypothetical protein
MVFGEFQSDEICLLALPHDGALQSKACNSSHSITKRGPGRPKGSKDTVPRRCKIKEVGLKDILPVQRSTFFTSADDSRIEALVPMLSVFSSGNNSLISPPLRADGPDDHSLLPWESSAIDSNWQRAQSSCSSIPRRRTQVIDSLENSAALSKKNAKLIEDDPFHFDWPHW